MQAHAPAGEEAVEVPLPQLARRVGREPAVDDHQPVPVLEQPQVDVVERERQRHAQPVHARRDLARLARRRRRGVRIIEDLLRIHCRGELECGGAL